MYIFFASRDVHTTHIYSPPAEVEARGGGGEGVQSGVEKKNAHLKRCVKVGNDAIVFSAFLTASRLATGFFERGLTLTW